MEKNMSKVFLSYAREDSFYATSLYDKLSVAGYQPFMDTKDIVPGENWARRIKKEIKSADFFLVLISSKSTN